MLEGERSLRKKVVQLESPVSVMHRTHEVVIEDMKDVSFLVMAVVLTALMFDHLDSIPMVPLICCGRTS